MASKRINEEVCPYCELPHADFTDDHIFPQFLGGRRTIRVCRDCNSKFGHSFEGRASRQLKRLQVFISNFGLDLSNNPSVWPSALVIDGKTYDLMSGPEGAQYKLSKPTINRSPEGKIIGGSARSKSEANKIAKGIIDSGGAKKFDISEDPAFTLEGVKLEAFFSFNDDIFRFATKLVAGVIVFSGNKKFLHASEIPKYLHYKGTWATRVAYCDITAVRQLRRPLTHTVYVELGQCSYGIVLIFGYQKIFVPLPSSSVREAFLAALDPLTGEEAHRKVNPIGALNVPPFLTKDAIIAHLREMNSALAEESTARGAKSPPTLEIMNVDLGPPALPQWTDSTLRFMRSLNPGDTRQKPS